MEYKKLIQGILVGSLFTGLALSAAAYVIVMLDQSVGDFGISPSDFWWLAMIIGFVLGSLFGAISGGAIIFLHLTSIKAAFFSLLGSLFAVFLFAVWTGGGWDQVTKYFLIAFIAIAILNGLLVTLVVGHIKALE